MNATTSPYPSASRWLWLAPALAIAFFFGFPLITIVLRGANLDGLIDTYTNGSILRMLWFTAWQAAASTALCLALSLPATYALSRFHFRGERLFLALLTTPFLLPTVVVGAAFTAVLPSQLHYTAIAIVAAHAFFNIAVVVRVVGAQWEQLSLQLSEAARTLGVSPLRAFATITLPLLRGSITAASVVVGLFSFTSYGVVRVLGGPARSTIETEIYTRAVLIGDLPGALVLSIGQMLVLSVAVAWWMRSNRRTNQMVLSSPHRTVAQRGRQRIVLIAIVLCTSFVVAAPMLALAWRSLRTANTFSLAGWNAVFSSATTGALQTSASFAIVTAIIATTLGMLVSFAVAYGSRRYAVLELVSALPLTVSAVTIGLGMLITFDVSPIDFRSAWLITPIAHSLIALPLVVRTTLPVVRAIPNGLREVAATMGANRWHRFRSIDWPLTQRAAATAGALSFAVSLGEFGATSFLTRRTSETLPVLISRLLSRTGDTVQAHAYALSTIFVISSIIGIYIADTMRKQQVSR